MNKIFENKKEIRLCDKYALTPDGYKGLVLTFSEERIRTKKDDTEEAYTYEDRWYFPKLSMVLSKYLSLRQMEATNLDELLSKVKEVEKTIEQFK